MQYIVAHYISILSIKTNDEGCLVEKHPSKLWNYLNRLKKSPRELYINPQIIVDFIIDKYGINWKIF